MSAFNRIRRSVGGKLFFMLLATLLLVISTLGFLTIRLHRRDLESATLQSAGRVSDVLHRSTTYYMLRNDRDGLYHIIRTMADEPGMVRVRIFNREGKISFSSHPSEVDRYVDKSAEACYGCHAQSQPLTHLTRPDRFRIYQAGGERVLGIINPIYNQPSCWNAACHAHSPDQKVLGVLDTNLSLASADANLASSFHRLFLYSLLGALAVAIFIGLFVWGVVHRPVRALRRATDRLGGGQLGVQIHVSSSDELGELSLSFNQMSRQLAEAHEESTAWARTLEDRVEEKSNELKSIHAQMLQAEKLASLGKMAAVVAHEINNPLSGILTYAKLIRKWIDRGERIEDRRTDMSESLQLIESESRRCGEIVRNLLTFARTSPMNLQHVEVNPVVRRCMQLVAHKLELANITATLDLSDDLPTVHGDPSQIEQVLLALVINAIDAMDQEGALRIATSSRSEPHEVALVVEDNGCGIPDDVLPNLFEPFVTTKGDGHGVGLGLAISKRIVERHGGRIEVDSSPGRGTKFTVIFPAEVAATDPVPESCAV
ncbi:MAG: ATP-binding protein [Thermoanaerobaculia bacterium]